MPKTPPREPEPEARQEPLLSSVCHDLRAPLAAVQMGTSFVLQSTPESPANERTRKILGAVLRSCTQMDRLLRNFSDLSHLEARDIALELSPFDARSVAELAVTAMRDIAASRRVELAIEMPDDPVRLRGDRERLVRALGHLLENAIKYGPEGSPVEVVVEDDASSVRYRVIDRGPGLPEDVLAHLFDRVWHSTRAGRSGTGLGLAIAKGFAELHGGRVYAENAEAGPTTFVLETPRDVAATPAAR
jgi:signal transduction histidine kinase